VSYEKRVSEGAVRIASKGVYMLSWGLLYFLSLSIPAGGFEERRLALYIAVGRICGSGLPVDRETSLSLLCTKKSHDPTAFWIRPLIHAAGISSLLCSIHNKKSR
jgi:hypothetical protein